MQEKGLWVKMVLKTDGQTGFIKVPCFNHNFKMGSCLFCDKPETRGRRIMIYKYLAYRKAGGELSFFKFKKMTRTGGRVKPERAKRKHVYNEYKRVSGI